MADLFFGFIAAYPAIAWSVAGILLITVEIWATGILAGFGLAAFLMAIGAGFNLLPQSPDMKLIIYGVLGVPMVYLGRATMRSYHATVLEESRAKAAGLKAPESEILRNIRAHIGNIRSRFKKFVQEIRDFL